MEKNGEETVEILLKRETEVIIEAFCKFAGIEFQPFAYQIHRMEVYADINADNKVDEKDYGKNRKLIPLDAFGHEIL